MSALTSPSLAGKAFARWWTGDDSTRRQAGIGFDPESVAWYAWVAAIEWMQANHVKDPWK